MIRACFTRAVRSLAAVLGGLLCLAGPAQAGDLAAAAANESLWTQSVEEVSKGVLMGVRFRAVDTTTLRIRRDANATFSGLRTGDIVLSFSKDHTHVALISTTIYNKGDDGEIDKTVYENLLKTSIAQLTKLLGAEPQQRKTTKKETGLRLRVWEWSTPRCAARLEAAASGSGRNYVSEFIRLTMAHSMADLERGGADDAVRRSDLKSNVKKHENGSVWIDGIPMVDQGEKGYCVPATLSRVFAYYGMDGVDQHALAALCSAGAQGTTLPVMEKGLRSISGAFHVNVSSMDWLNHKALEKEMNITLKKKNLSVQQLTPAILLECLRAKPSLMRKGFKDIQRQIDAGIPVVWAVLLGVFPEQGLPQSQGGHVRLIIGYNESMQAILYSDSWGAGHEVKAMPIAQASLITQALYVLRPQR